MNYIQSLIDTNQADDAFKTALKEKIEKELEDLSLRVKEISEDEVSLEKAKKAKFEEMMNSVLERIANIEAKIK